MVSDGRDRIAEETSVRTLAWQSLHAQGTQWFNNLHRYPLQIHVKLLNNFNYIQRICVHIKAISIKKIANKNIYIMTLVTTHTNTGFFSVLFSWVNLYIKGTISFLIFPSYLTTNVFLRSLQICISHTVSPHPTYST